MLQTPIANIVVSEIRKVCVRIRLGFRTMRLPKGCRNCLLVLSKRGRSGRKWICFGRERCVCLKCIKQRVCRVESVVWRPSLIINARCEEPVFFFGQLEDEELEHAQFVGALELSKHGKEFCDRHRTYLSMASSIVLIFQHSMRDSCPRIRARILGCACLTYPCIRVESVDGFTESTGHVGILIPVDEICR